MRGGSDGVVHVVGWEALALVGFLENACDAVAVEVWSNGGDHAGESFALGLGEDHGFSLVDFASASSRARALSFWTNAAFLDHF
ncbi:hypothetical protein D3C74_439660 [compost metagenome]